MNLEANKPYEDDDDDVILIENNYSIVIVDDDSDVPIDTTDADTQPDASEAVQSSAKKETPVSNGKSESNDTANKKLPKRDTSKNDNILDPQILIAKLQGLEKNHFNAAIKKGASKADALKAAQTFANKRQLRQKAKLKKKTAKPTNQQINLGFIASDRTCVLTAEQIDALQSAILVAASVDIGQSDIRPQFVGTERRKGWLLLKCVNNNSAEWVRRKLNEIRKHCNCLLDMVFQLIEEKEFPQNHTIQGIFCDSQELSNKSVLSFIEAQNQLKTEYWEVKQRTVKKNELHITMLIDGASMLALTKCQGKIAYRLGQMQLQLNAAEQPPPQAVSLSSTKPEPKQTVAPSTAVSVSVSASDKQTQKSNLKSGLAKGLQGGRSKQNPSPWQQNKGLQQSGGYQRNNGYQQHQRFQQNQNYQQYQGFQGNQGFQQQNALFHNFDFGLNNYQTGYNFQLGQHTQNLQQASQNSLHQILQAFDVLRSNSSQLNTGYQPDYSHRHQNFF